jgi:hypothetical protein
MGSDARRLLPYPITFLYRYTDPQRDSTLNAFGDERTPAQPLRNQEHHSADNQLLEGDMALFGIFSDLAMDTGTDMSAFSTMASERPQTTPNIQPRVDELCSQLFAYSQTRQTASSNSDDIFPVNAAKAAFTAKNFEECVWAYFTVVHPQHPILHWPTFDINKVSLPLLLAIVFGGSVNSSPTDGALSSRAFFDLGEGFIFKHLHDVVATPNPGEYFRALEAVQASLLMVALQGCFNSVVVRQRIQVSRHSELTVAIRSLKLLDPLITTEFRNKIPEWNIFVAEESRVRYINHQSIHRTRKLTARLTFP